MIMESSMVPWIPARNRTNDLERTLEVVVFGFTEGQTPPGW